MKITKNPLGICVSGQFVYVTDYGGHYVSMFTTAGDYVTSFSQKERVLSKSLLIATWAPFFLHREKQTQILLWGVLKEDRNITHNLVL